jgi:hypothetical protein
MKQDAGSIDYGFDPGLAFAFRRRLEAPDGFRK